jgi:hypothetical protein
MGARAGSSPSRKVTVPIGVPPFPDTVAVNVTDWATAPTRW